MSAVSMVRNLADDSGGRRTMDLPLFVVTDTGSTRRAPSKSAARLRGSAHLSAKSESRNPGPSTPTAEDGTYRWGISAIRSSSSEAGCSAFWRVL